MAAWEAAVDLLLVGSFWTRPPCAAYVAPPCGAIVCSCSAGIDAMLRCCSAGWGHAVFLLRWH